MADNIFENNMYSLKKLPWHKKGIVGQENETAISVYSRMKPVDFVTAPFKTTVEGIDFDSGLSGIFRVENGKVIEIGEFRGRYQITQPKEYVEAFDAYVNQPVETMGFLGSKAEKFFTTWSLPQIDIHGDKMEVYGMLAAGFNGKFGEHLYCTNVRVVCQNTFNMAVSEAQGSNNQGRGNMYSQKHTQKDHLNRLGYWMQYLQQDSEKTVEMMKSLFCKMEEKPISVDDAYGLFAKVYPYPGEFSEFCPPELKDEYKEKHDDKKESADEKRDLAMSLFQGAGIQISPTVYGAFNAITELENHHIDCRKNDGTDSILIGSRQNIMSNAFSAMSQYSFV
jgi:hypothetical protein